MFKKGDYIVYDNTGICVIEDVTTIDLPGIAKERLYYVMTPYGQTGNRIFTPVDNPKMNMRKLLSKEETLALIDEMPDIEDIRIEQEKLREQEYKKCIQSCECRNWIRIMKTLYHRKQERVSQGKKITATDERYYKIAETNLYTEFSLALGIEKSELEEYIIRRVKGLSI